MTRNPAVPIARFGLALLAIAMAWTLHQLGGPWPGGQPPWLIYLAAILLCGWFGGLGPSLLAVGLSGLAIIHAQAGGVEPGGWGWASLAMDLVFLGNGLAISLMSGASRAALRCRPAREVEESRSPREESQATLACIADAVITADTKGRVVMLNPAAETLTGWPSAEALGCPLSEVLDVAPEGPSPAGEPAKADAWLPVGSRGSLASRISLIARDGSRRAAELKAATLHDHRGDAIGTVIVLREIGERLKDEEALRDSERKFRQLADTMPQIVWTARPDGSVDYFNKQWYDYTGMTPEGSMTNDGWRSAIHPEDLGRLFRQRNQAVHEGGIFVNEVRTRDRQGRYRWHLVRSVPVPDGPVRVARRIGTATDIDDRKRLEDELHERMRELNEADHRKDEFLATLAHELRNPMAPIRNALHLMGRSGALPADLEEERRMAERQVIHLAHLVDDLMDVARINQGRIELRKEVVDLTTLLRNAVESARPAARERRHELILELPDEPISLKADPTRLDQILGNLLSNAIKYTESGGRIWLTVNREGGQAVIHVRDTGIGIEPALLKSVFGMFVQVDRGWERSQGGLGIGLGLVKSLVELHGGSVEAQSAGRGLGCEFVLRLPALPRSFVAPAEAPRVAQPSENRQPERRRVLVVDDNEDAARSLAKLLTRLHGQTVEIAHDGQEALEVAERFHPEVVFLDIGMPGMDGYEVARRLRARPELAKTLLVALTGWGQESDRQRSRDSGFDRHLVKPADPETLRILLNESGDAQSPSASSASQRS